MSQLRGQHLIRDQFSDWVMERNGSLVSFRMGWGERNLLPRQDVLWYSTRRVKTSPLRTK